MTTPPSRKRFQIHLSTAIVMMFVAGGLMWANLTPRKNVLTAYLITGYTQPIDINFLDYGWRVGAYRVEDNGSQLSIVNYIVHAAPKCLILNGATALFLFVTSILLCECLIRRRSHLSTAIVMMFVVGGLIWVNTNPRTIVWVDGLGSPKGFRRRIFGWPAEFMTLCEELGVQGHPADEVASPAVPSECNTNWLEITASHLLLDAVLAMLLIVVVYLLCEWLTRRRPAGKGA